MNEKSPSAPPRLTIVAAVAKNRVIGAGNALPWRLPEDLRRFKALTLGHPIVMGRKTWDSLGRPLPGRTHIVVSRDARLRAAGAERACSLDEAIARATTAPGSEEIFIIGGAEIYRQALPLAQRMQITEIDRDFDGDVFFPPFDPREWIEKGRERHRSETGLDYAFITYERHH